MTERGKIRNREYKNQVLDFSGLRFGNITATDIDGLFDFGGRLFVLVECKYSDSKMPHGQEWALRNLCDAIHNPPYKYAIVFVVSHHDAGDIDMSKTIVTQFRWNGEWHVPLDDDLTLFEAVTKIVEKYRDKPL